MMGCGRVCTDLPLRESTKQELADSLARYSYEVLYIVCHGEIRKGRSGFLNLQGMDGLSGEELIDLLRIQHVDRPLSLAVICACNSATPSEDDAAFALAPALLRVGLARRAVGFTAPVLQEAAMALGIELLNQKLSNGSWEEAYFHAKAILKWGSYWPILRMFVSGTALRKYEVSGSPAAWSPPRQVPYLSDDKPASEFAARYPQLADWLQRTEDPNLLSVTGPGERGKTRLVVQLVRYCQYLRTKRIGDGARASEKQGDGPREICWIPEVALQELRKPDADPGESIWNWLDARARESAPRNERSQPLTKASDVLSASSCLLNIDGWPVDRAFPMLAWGPFWKIVVTARSLPPCASPRSLEYAMELLTTDALQTHFLHHMPSTPRASRPNYTYALVTALTRSLVGNWLILQLAKRAWIQCWYESSASTDVVTKEIEILTSALTRRRSEQQQVATLVENALERLPEKSRRCWARLEQLRTRMRNSWLALDLAAKLEEEKCSGEKSSFDDHFVKVRNQLDTLRDWGLLGYDAASQTYRVPSVIVEGQKPRTG